MPVGSVEQDNGQQQQLQQRGDQDRTQSGEKLPPEMLQSLQSAGPDAAALAAAVQAQPQLEAESLEWIEVQHGLAARARVNETLAQGNEKANGATYTVQPGDSLSAIARQVLGDPARWRELYELNKGSIGNNPNAIRPGQQLSIPPANEGPAAQKVQAAVQSVTQSAPATPTVQEAKGKTPALDKDPNGADANKPGGAETKPSQAPVTAQAATGSQVQESPESQASSQTSQVSAQFGTFAQRVASKTAANAQGAVTNEAEQKGDAKEAELGQAGGDRFESQGKLGPRDKQLFSHSDPLLGQFDVILNMGGDLGTRVSEKYLHITSAGGLTVRTPKGMSDLTIHSIRLNLETMKVSVGSKPDIGPMEEKILQEVLKETILAQAPQLVEQGKSPVAKAMEGLPANAAGEHIAWQYKDPIFGTPVAQILLPPNPSAGVNFNKSGLKVSMHPGMHFKIPGPDYHVGELEYDFSTASFQIRQQGSTTMWGVVGDWLKQPLLEGIEWVGGKFFRSKLPAAMRQAGYDPTIDPNLQQNLDQLYMNFTGVSLTQSGQKKDQPQAGAEGENQAGPAAGPTNAGPAAQQGPAQEGAQNQDDAATEQVLYRLPTKKFGEVDVCLEKDDAATIYKDAKQVGLDTKKGLYLKVPGHDWVEDIRLKSIRYDLETGEIDIEGSQQVGAFVDTILEDLVRAYVLPKLPGDIAAGVGVGGLEADDTHQLLYSADAPQVGKVDLLLEKEDRLSLTKSAEAIELSASQGLIIRAAGIPALSELRIQRIHYRTEDGKITIDSDRDVGPLTEKIVSQIVRTAVVPQLPGGAEGLGLKGPDAGDKIDPKKLERFSQVVYSKTTKVGVVEARLAGGDTLGVAADEDTMRVYGTDGVLIYAPDLGIDLTIRELNFNYQTGEVDIISDAPLGKFEKDVLQGIAKDLVLPMVKEHYQRPDQNPNADHTVLYHYEGKGLKADVALDKGDELKIEKSDEFIDIITTNGLALITEAPGIPENVRLHRVRLDLKTGQIVINSNPDVGPLGETIATKLVRALVFPELPPELAMIGIEAPKEEEEGERQPLPEKESLSLYEGSLPEVGGFDVSVNGKDNTNINTTATNLSFSSPTGILVRVPGLDLAVRISKVDLNLMSGEADITASTQLGAFELQLVKNLFKQYGQPMLAEHIRDPRKSQDDPNFDVLYNASLPNMGDFAVCTGKGGGVSVKKTDTHIELTASKGIFLQGIDWLPDFEVTRVSYELHTGQFEIDAGGVHQGRYIEGQDIGPITEDAVSGIVKALVGPHLPPQAQQIGIVGEKEDKQAKPGPRGTVLFDKTVPKAGNLQVILRKGDNLSIAATEKEAMISTQLGLVVHMPDIETTASIRYIKYHFETGEIQIDGMGAVENALMEAAVKEFVTPLLPKQMQTDTPIGDHMKHMPTDRKGRRQLMDSDSLDVYLEPGARFDVTIGGGGLKFVAQPGIGIDATGLFNYHLKKLDFDFSSRKFKVDTSGDNIIAGIFNPIARGKAEKELNKLLLPLMPGEMLAPGYDLTNDPNFAEHVAEIVANFGAQTKKSSEVQQEKPKTRRKKRRAGRKFR